MSPNPQEQVFETQKGRVLLRDRVSPQEVSRLNLDLGIGVFSAYRSLLTSLDSLAAEAERPQANLCLAIGPEDKIVGFAVLRPPLPGERWEGLNPPVMFELFGEMARGWRQLGLMRPMLQMLVEVPANDDRIVYIVGYSWHWDLDGSKKTMQQYRDTIISLLDPLGFKQYPTNEPNVSLRAENLFMARVGENIPPDVVKRFHHLLFGIED